MLWSLLHFLLSKLCSVFMFEQKREDRYLCYFNLWKNLPQVSSVLKLLNVRTFTRNLFDPDFSSMELYLVSQTGLNNHFPLQRLIPFPSFNVLFFFVDPLTSTRRLFRHGLIFQTRRTRRRFTRVSRLIFPCQTYLQKRLPVSSEEERSSDDCFIICCGAKAYSRDVSPESATKKRESCPAFPSYCRGNYEENSRRKLLFTGITTRVLILLN